MTKVQKRRRRENKTNYSKRLKLLKSEKPRIVFRKTNKHIIAQYVESDEAQDRVIIGLTSKELLDKGWPKSSEKNLRNISASYLTGYMIGKKVLSKKLSTPIIDLGMARVLRKTKIFAFIKGLIDSGLDIPCDEEAFPSDERIRGEHLKNKIDIEKIKLNIDKE